MCEPPPPDDGFPDPDSSPRVLSRLLAASARAAVPTGGAPGCLDRAPGGSQGLVHADVPVLLDDDILRTRIDEWRRRRRPRRRGQ